jgi:hypothetical protein
VKIVYNRNDEIINFGVRQITKILEKKDIFYTEQHEDHVPKLLPHSGIVIILHPFRSHSETPRFVDQSFCMRKEGELLFIEGSDSRGLLYGCLEWADLLSKGADLADGESIDRQPALGIRGIKYNLPFVPFAEGDPLSANLQTCMDMNFWRAYLDMLAQNRYNCLSLWSEHPFHLLVVSPKYRDANPFSDLEIDRNIRFFKELFLYAKHRGIDIYLFTWNIRLTPEIARGLGFPEELGHFNKSESGWRPGVPLNRYRQESDVIKDYFREMVLQTLLTYPDLKGLGTSASEWMAGDGYEREEWIVETYVEAIKQSGRKIPFIHRTNYQKAGKEIKELVQGQFLSEDFYISWKYSNAHCYSHPLPQFEKLWDAWEDIDLDRTQVLYTVRNDDVHTHRWGDPDYVRAYVKGMLKPYVKGFYWGADGYTWGLDFQHIGHGHKTWEYDFERHLFQFQLWGRLSYNPDTDDSLWPHLVEGQYGKLHASHYIEGLKQASRIIPAVNRLFWLDYDTQWHPESCLSKVTGFKTILDFMDCSPMPGVGVMGLQAYAEAEQNSALGLNPNKDVETPPDIIRQLKEAADETERIVQFMRLGHADTRTGHAECTLLDLESYVEMGRYYACKFHAALELNRYRLNGNEENKNKAVALLETSYGHWERMGLLWSRHNKPYVMARVKMTFGYPYYLDNVQKDVEIARKFSSPNIFEVGEAK